jgi:hypothetical protein
MADFGLNGRLGKQWLVARMGYDSKRINGKHILKIWTMQPIAQSISDFNY